MQYFGSAASLCIARRWICFLFYEYFEFRTFQSRKVFLSDRGRFKIYLTAFKLMKFKNVKCISNGTKKKFEIIADVSTFPNSPRLFKCLKNLQNISTRKYLKLHFKQLITNWATWIPLRMAFGDARLWQLISALDCRFPIPQTYYRDLDGNTIWLILEYSNLKFYWLFRRERLLGLTGIEYYRENHARVTTRDSNEHSISRPRRYYEILHDVHEWCHWRAPLRVMHFADIYTARQERTCSKEYIFK